MLSDSAILSTTSENDGTEPVVIALIRGIVTVGELACAVNGHAAPVRIKLRKSASSHIHNEWIRIKGQITDFWVNTKPELFEYTKSLMIQ